MLRDKVVDYLEEKGLEYEESGDSIGSQFFIEGRYYNVEISTYKDEKKVYLLTTNKERLDYALKSDEYSDTDAYEYAEGNGCYRKSIRGVKNYIEKYID